MSATICLQFPLVLGFVCLFRTQIPQGIGMFSEYFLSTVVTSY